MEEELVVAIGPDGHLQRSRAPRHLLQDVLGSVAQAPLGVAHRQVPVTVGRDVFGHEDVVDVSGGDGVAGLDGHDQLADGARGSGGDGRWR